MNVKQCGGNFAKDLCKLYEMATFCLDGRKTQGIYCEHVNSTFLLWSMASERRGKIQRVTPPIQAPVTR